jgi:hypothetical protein
MIIFPFGKYMNNEKITENEILARLQPGYKLIDPLEVLSSRTLGREGQPDARIEVSSPDSSDRFQFVVEVKAQNTPAAVRNAIAKVKSAAAPGEKRMIIVPYLSPESLSELEQEEISGVDLCGNGVVIVPGRLYVSRTGQPNRFRDSRPLNNPYAGRSGLVARILLSRQNWNSLNELVAAIREAGADLSLPQASKTIQALKDDLIVSKKERLITLQEPLRLLDKLGSAYRTYRTSRRQPMKLTPGFDWAKALSSEPALRWAVTGESSAAHYLVLGEIGPNRVAVSNLSTAYLLLMGADERVFNFADIELVETKEPGSFFQNEIDEQGVRWASRIQTWLELQAGDARQQEASRDLRSQILNKMRQ